MTDTDSYWIIFTFAALAVAAAIVVFLRTPRERRYRVFSRTSIEEQLKDCSESAQAVVIKGDKKRALIKLAPYIFFGTVLFGFSLWSKSTDYSECTRLFGVNTTYIWLLLLCYGLPVGFFITSLMFLQTGIKIIKTGYFPPLDSVVFRDTIAKKGVITTLRGFILIILPVFTLYVVYLGYIAYSEITDGKNRGEITEKLEQKC